MVPFAGYQMPVQYTGVIDEHRAVRQAAGLFDVSHMGEFMITGPGAGALLDHVTPSRISALPVGKAIYSALPTPRGCFVDDILVYRLGEDRFLLVVNAANKDKDWAWLEGQRAGYEVSLEDQTEATALMALQGPRARRILAGLAEGFEGMAVKYYNVVEGKVAGRPVIASRTGYTGELGWEIFLSPEDAPVVWTALLEAGAPEGLRPAGLGARDSLRLEAALPLYGNDIDEETTILEAGLEFTIDWEKEEFIGHLPLREQKAAGVERRRAGFEIRGRGIARPGHTVVDGERVLGQVTSGSWSPSLERAIGMAYLPMAFQEVGAEIAIEVRGRRLPARVTALPFYRRPKKNKRS